MAYAGKTVPSSRRMRKNGLELYQRRFTFDIRFFFSTEIMVRHWNKLAGQVVESPSLELLQICLDGALGDVV